jgi:hypothetical protein
VLVGADAMAAPTARPGPWRELDSLEDVRLR